MKKITLLIALLNTCFHFNASAQPTKTEVKIIGVRSSKGNIILNIFKDDAGYQDLRPIKKFVFDKALLTNGTLTVNFEFEAGTFGITLIDDENANGKIDKNLIGIPKEGFGFANFNMSGLSKPSFDDFKITLKSTQNNIAIKIKYM